MTLCCTDAVYDYAAGWWCPHHGDQMQIAAEREQEIAEPEEDIEP